MAKKKPATLKDYDEKTIETITNLIKSKAEILNTVEAKDETKCQFCGGELTMVVPEKTMADMVLFECISCKERCYREQ